MVTCPISVKRNSYGYCTLFTTIRCHCHSAKKVGHVFHLGVLIYVQSHLKTWTMDVCWLFNWRFFRAFSLIKFARSHLYDFFSHTRVDITRICMCSLRLPRPPRIIFVRHIWSWTWIGSINGLNFWRRRACGDIYRTIRLMGSHSEILSFVGLNRLINVSAAEIKQKIRKYGSRLYTVDTFV